MGKLNVKNGTPVGNFHLCKNCDWSQYTTGYRESDVLVFCTNTSPSFRVPFTVHECSQFQDKSKPDWEQMEKLAIQIHPLRVSKKTKGFHVGLNPETNKPEPDEPEFEEPTEDVDELAGELELEDVDAVGEFALQS
jgi:hypothetical protein